MHQPGLDRSRGHVERDGDLRHAQIFQIEQRQRRALRRDNAPDARFRDIKHTLPFIIQIWMYASPIVYPLSMVPAQWQGLYSLNPMVGVIEGFRWAVFNQGEPNFAALAVSGVVIIFLLAGGLVFFRRMERTFADVI